MGRLIDADICLNKAWQNFYKQEDEHEKNIDGYDIMRDQFYEQSGFECCQQTIVDAPTVEAIPKDQYEARLKENNELINDLEELRTMINKFAESYENRLKADLVAMLEELNLEIDEMFVGRIDYTVDKIQDLIQQKINALKAESEEKE